jgi:hypothetical protein
MVQLTLSGPCTARKMSCLTKLSSGSLRQTAPAAPCPKLPCSHAASVSLFTQAGRQQAGDGQAAGRRRAGRAGRAGDRQANAVVYICTNARILTATMMHTCIHARSRSSQTGGRCHDLTEEREERR